MWKCVFFNVCTTKKTLIHNVICPKKVWISDVIWWMSYIKNYTWSPPPGRIHRIGGRSTGASWRVVKNTSASTAEAGRVQIVDGRRRSSGWKRPPRTADASSDSCGRVQHELRTHPCGRTSASIVKCKCVHLIHWTRPSFCETKGWYSTHVWKICQFPPCAYSSIR